MDIYNPTKTCTKCGIEKPVSEFSKNNRPKSGLQPKCKSCNKEYRDKNKENIKKYDKEYKQKNRERIILQNRKYRENNKEKINKYYKYRRTTDPLFKLKHDIRILVRMKIKNKGYEKNSRTHIILGCDYQTLMEHLESQFDDNMNWSNHGTYWDIDHIIPVSSANTEEEVLALNHYTNLQPLESYYNRYVKGSNVIPSPHL